MRSITDETPMISISNLAFNAFMLFFEIKHREKPNFRASFNLSSVWLTPLTSPERPTSPIQGG